MYPRLRYAGNVPTPRIMLVRRTLSLNIIAWGARMIADTT